ncbi:MAG: hypothetical protein IKV45_01135 [Firmicutes bacterium]|nr:hypothetical protein [Bacillota bacterium]
MEKRFSIVRIVILVLCSIVPLLFPFGGRETYLTQYFPSFIDVADGTYLPWVLMFCYVVFPLYWAFYGYLFYRWSIGFKTSMILGNIPIFLNVIGEIFYYVIWGYAEEQYPMIAYLLGSHIDKVNISHICSISSVTLSIGVSAFVFLLFFYLGYSIRGYRIQSKWK